MNALAYPLAAGTWSSLEVVKLVVGIGTPVVVAYFGFRLTALARTVEQHQWADRKYIERRLEVFDRMAEPLNDLYVFFRTVGHFQEITPPEAIVRKRTLDREFFINRSIFSPTFAQAYDAFIAACFKPYTKVGHSALLRTSSDQQRKERGAGWKDEWNALFVTPGEITRPRTSPGPMTR